jgi:hypothetical protein
VGLRKNSNEVRHRELLLIFQKYYFDSSIEESATPLLADQFAQAMR